jgi:hypothetical protein
VSIPYCRYVETHIRALWVMLTASRAQINGKMAEASISRANLLDPQAIAFPLPMKNPRIAVESQRAVMLQWGPAFFFSKPRKMTQLRTEKARRIQKMKRQKKRDGLKLTSGSSEDEKPAVIDSYNPLQLHNQPTEGNSYYYSSDWFDSPPYGRFRKVVLLHGNWWGNAVLVDDEAQDAWWLRNNSDDLWNRQKTGPKAPPPYNPNIREIKESKATFNNSQLSNSGWGGWRGLPEPAPRRPLSVAAIKPGRPFHYPALSEEAECSSPVSEEDLGVFSNAFGAPVLKFNTSKSRPLIEVLL